MDIDKANAQEPSLPVLTVFYAWLGRKGDIDSVIVCIKWEHMVLVEKCLIYRNRVNSCN